MGIRVRVWASAAFVAAAAMIGVGATLVATASSASADVITSGGVLSLDATPGTLADGTMAPGDTLYWPISANLDASTSGELSLQIRSSGALATSASGLRLSLFSCPDAWSNDAIPTCDGGAGHLLIADTAFKSIDASKRWELGTMAAVSQMPMMATISLPPAVPTSLQDSSATMNFGFTALGDTENATPSDPRVPVLGFTGIDPTGPLLLGFGLLLAGATLGRLRVLARRRSAVAS
jgi:hypothetical protein